MILNKRNMTTRIWRMKDGVSLFTVLMFMLVATIAATATYKWITTESSSSTDRMIQREAYQSALAGIESARGWMTYNANETGALIKQYKDGNNAPIKLNDRLAAFVRAGQSYDVYLVGVSASPENPTYKLKLVSVGYARDKRVKHSEVAILNVNGLYQVRLPVHTSSDTSDFQYAYFGGTVTYEGSSVVTSMVVNGDWDKNPPKTTEGDFVVTGNATLSGNDIYVQKTACIGGKLESNNGFIAQNFLGMGPVKDLNPIIYNNAYFAGTFNMGQSCNAPDNSKGFYVGGNMTVAGTFNFDKCGTGNIGEGTPRTVAGNTCVIGNGQIKTDGNLVALKGSAWMESDYPIWRDDNDNYDDYNRFVIGTDANSNIYIKSGHPWSDYDGTLRAKKFKQVKNAPGENGFRSCKDGVYYYGWWLCEPADDGWDNAEYQPYPTRDEKDNLYYIYYMSPGTTDIDFGSFTEDKWHKCNHWGGGGCMPGDFVKLNAYFINFTAKEKKYIFTSSTHSQDDNHTVKVGENYYRYLNHDGSSITGSPFCHLNSGKTWQPICGVKPWFKVDGQFKTWSDNQPADVECAESVKAHCDSIWEYTPGAGCEGKDGTKANYTVRDQVVTGYNVFKTFANRPKCAKDIIGLDDNAMTNYDVEVGSKSLKDCYDSAAKHDKDEPDATKKHLYNGYLVIELDNAKLLKNASGKLDGKFIIIINHNEGRDIKLPATKDADDYLFLYLKEGLNNIDMTGANNNTFIYSDGDINEFHGNNHTLSGSVYAKAANCARVKKMWTSDLVFNPPLVNDLATNGVICDASTSNESTCGGVNQDDPASSSGYDDGPIGEGGYDPYYIGVAPQLSVTVESQYKNKETVNVEQSPEVKASFIVLPRIVYLTKDAKGKLSNYYNIVPLNTTKGVTGTSVSCNGIPTSGKLTDGGELEEGAYTCSVSGSVTATAVGTGNTSTTQMRVPFWVVVKGEGGTLPLASFADQTKEVNIGASTVASLVLPSTTGALQSCNVKFTVSEHGTDWVVEPTANATQDAGVYTAVVTSEAAVPVLNVTNISSDDGSVILTVTAESEGCNPGSPEVIYNANTATIKRYSIETYCNGEGSSDDKCSSGGEYDRAKNRPDCVTSEEWVTVQGNSCSVSSTNQTWSCAISGNISLKAVGSVDGCETIVSHLSHPAPLTVGEEYKLYASLKALPMTFHTGFETSKDIPEDTKIKIEVSDESGTRNSVCSYSNFKNEETRATYCDVLVYRNSTVTLTLGTEPDPKDFNYWKCEGGPDCFSDEPFTGNSYEITITGDGNTVYAHFGEQDKHCFFDEFRDALENGGTVKRNRETIKCVEGSTNYCIDYCENDGNKCPTNQVTSSFPNAKWRFVERSTASWDSLDYSSTDARIALKSGATRGKKESEKMQAIIMSSVQAGAYGTMKAVFQPPREGVSSGDQAKATVKKSGFILRSNADVSSYLMLNVFVASDGVLKARLCVNGGSSCSEDVMLKNKDGSSYSPEQNHLVTLSATIEQKDGESSDILSVKVYSSAWAEEPDSAEIKLSNNEISGVANTSTNEYVGYALSDQNFKIYGIGWRSETYNSTCWDTYPTISCSFKAAYPAGIVPLNTASKPWVGFSAWFDEFDGGCDEEHVNYYYRGSDACGGTNSDWRKCLDATNPYTFSDTGAHGYYDGDNAVRMAMVSVLPENCTVYGSEANWIGGSTATDCGSFWVGEQNACSRHYVFESTVSGDEGDYFGLADGTANVRGAKLYVTLDNPNGNTVEVYLFSKNEADRYTYYGNKEFIYSLPYQSSMTGEDIRIEIPVEDISNAEGFDPEHVQGVYVKTFNEPSVNIKKVESSCPNAVEITGCSATYSGGKWNIVAEIKNKSHTKQIDVIETNSYISNPSSLSCDYDSGDSPCVFDGDNVKFGWTDNPYAGHAGTEYEFRISLTSKEKTTSECTTTGSVTGIKATCGYVYGTDVEQGEGIPQFEYSIANCPDATSCNYQIQLVKDGAVIDPAITSTTSSGNVTDAKTATNAANNGSSNKLAVGTYKFRLSSINPARPFTECESEASFTVSAPGEIKADCSFGTVAKGETAKLSMTNIKNNKNNTPISIERDGASAIEKTLVADNSSQTFEFTAPNSVGSYNYTVYYPTDDGKTEICKATLEVVDGLSCKIMPTTTITLGDEVTFSAEGGGTCRSSTLTGSATGAGTPTQTDCYRYKIKPTAAGNYNYEYTFDGELGDGLHCPSSVTLTVNPPAPEFTCPDNWTGTVGSNATFNPGSSLKYCSSDYPCVLKIDGVTKSSSWTGPTYEWKDDAATTSTTKYRISLKNSYNDAATVQDCDITYTSGEPGGGCSCTDYCTQSQCDNLKTSGTFAFDGNCYFATSISIINGQSDKTYYINGVEKTGYINSGFPAKVDGGYYIKTPSSGSVYNETSLSLGSATCGSGSGGGSGGGETPSYDETITIKQGSVLTKGKTYKITGCESGGSRIQLNNAPFQNCVDIFGTGGSYWYNNANDCGGEISVSYPIYVTTPSGTNVTIGNCGN